MVAQPRGTKSTVLYSGKFFLTRIASICNHVLDKTSNTFSSFSSARYSSAKRISLAFAPPSHTTHCAMEPDRNVIQPESSKMRGRVVQFPAKIQFLQEGVRLARFFTVIINGLKERVRREASGQRGAGSVAAFSQKSRRWSRRLQKLTALAEATAEKLADGKAKKEKPIGPAGGDGSSVLGCSRKVRSERAIQHIKSGPSDTERAVGSLGRTPKPKRRSKTKREATNCHI